MPERSSLQPGRRIPAHLGRIRGIAVERQRCLRFSHRVFPLLIVEYTMMDGLSGVASIVAVVTVALQSVSVIHETIGRIRGGPAELRRLDSSLRDLNQVLKQLSALTEDSRQRDAHDYGDLEGSAARCAADVKNMEQTILRFCRKTDERLAGRTWRRIHLALRGDQLREMQERIQHHEQRLVLQLNIFGW